MRLLNQNELDIAASILREGGVVAFPTETVYGLGVIFDDKEAYIKLVAVKRRPPDKPFTLMLADPEDIEKYAILNNLSKALIKAFIPGQFTIIVKSQPFLPTWCISEVGAVGIRIADYKLTRDLIRKTGKPLLVPSANKSGETPATTLKEVVKSLGEEIDGVVEGDCISNTPSTIVLIEENYVKILREGVVTKADIENAVGKEKVR